MKRLSAPLYNYIQYLGDFNTHTFTRQRQDGDAEHVFEFRDGPSIIISKRTHDAFIRQRNMGRA
jgi:hypothetical protein